MISQNNSKGVKRNFEMCLKEVLGVFLYCFKEIYESLRGILNASIMFQKF